MTTVPPNTVSPESSVPLIDLGPFRTGNKQEQDVVAAAVHRAFVDVGFVYLTITVSHRNSWMKHSSGPKSSLTFRWQRK